jgi:hypothetical protein
MDRSVYKIVTFVAMGEVPEGATSLDAVTIQVVKRVEPDTPSISTSTEFFSYLTST